MTFFTYEIESAFLRPFIRYILFNYAGDPAANTSLTYFPNNDVCLGLIRSARMLKEDESFIIRPSGQSFTSYLTGIYDRPHKLEVRGMFDEICLPFSPLGFFHFFPFPLKQYLLGDDVLSEAFGKASVSLFEQVFEESSFWKRGSLIEQFLLEAIGGFDDDFLKSALYHLEHCHGSITLKELCRQLRCSEKRLQRRFVQQLDILPKEYSQILKFRKALNLLGSGDEQTLGSVCYEADYYDQSHFIRHIHRYTGKTPSELRRTIRNIDQKVLFNCS
ncbi:MAG TPA: AraC family transcriptional regulator [Flavisolibacter sp.]|nr:AraC family transcriptional regulator [Flavisolibacter sp.]